MSYFRPIEDGKYPKQKRSRLSDELFELIKKEKFANMGGPSTQWIFLEDCILRGSISPLEAYDALELGYMPEHLTIRESLYKNY